MPSIRNQNQLKDLYDKFARAKSLVFTDYSGLSVAEQTELRAKVAKAGGEFGVAKNTLLKLALSGNGNTIQTDKISKGATEILQGPTAVLLSYQDEILPLKVVVEFAKGREKPTIKGGMLNGQPLTANQVVALSKLPSREELLIKLMRQIQEPMYGMARTLNGNIAKLVLALNAVKERGN